MRVTLITPAGGIDCFAENAKHQGGKGRIVTDPMIVVQRKPDIILGSWYRKRFHPHKVAQRDGWQDVPAVVNSKVYEIKSANILQPRSAALSDGLDQLYLITSSWGENIKNA